ncbi:MULTISPECIES: hypothetical protein [Nocardia]|uniref:hypothetical protein n=1 Tax=Nocardia TaxID=1817 RepID=UPI000D699E00|nr:MULTISPECIES: hypothetical protein [Nocardia]
MADWISDEQLTEWAEYARYPDGDDTHRLVRELVKLRQLVAVFASDDPCQFDHHGNCQGHNMILEPGEMCPQAEARQYLAGVSGDE